MMLTVACLQLFLAPVFMQATGDYWDEWGPYGECSRTCGGGVTVRLRRCVTQRTDGGHSCIGPEKSYRSCNIQDCPEGSRDFREEQCSQYDGTDFQGKRYKWLPYYSAENPCELNCIPRGENFYFRHKSAVVDGTPCHPGGKDLCVEGLCKELGDKSSGTVDDYSFHPSPSENYSVNPSSEKEKELGDKSSGTVDDCGFHPSPSENYSVNPSSEKEKELGDKSSGTVDDCGFHPSPSENYSVNPSSEKEKELGDKSSGTVDDCGFHPSPSENYSVNPSSEKEKELGDKSSGTVDDCGFHPSPSENYSVNPSSEKEKRLGCDNMLESPQEEDPCLQCGGNGQSCEQVKNNFSMRTLPKGYNQMFIIPVGATTISIRENIPTRNYLAIKNLRGEYYLNGHWVIDFSRATPIASTMLYYQRGTEGEKTPEVITGRGPTTEPLVIELITQEPNEGVEYEYYLPKGRSTEGYYWSSGSWSACSKECGSGYQSRLVFCTIDNEAYPDYLCSSIPRPLTNRTCNEQQCPQTHRWMTGEWNPCPVTCGGGLQVRRVECMSHDMGGSRVVEDSQCAAYAPRPLSQQNCNMQKCAQYRVYTWSQCSVSCGSGQQMRDVVCIGSDGLPLEDYACGTQPKPPRTQTCEMPACRNPIGWHIGDWGLCSKSCGSGLRERQVICSDRHRTLYRAEECQANPKPSTVETCNAQLCYRPQEVPSMPDPTGYDNTVQGFQPYFNDPSLATPQHKAVNSPYGTTVPPHCSQTWYGCCPDGVTPAGGPQRQGCAQDAGQPSCTRSRYGCCRDGVTVAQGPNKEGCLESWLHWPLTTDPVPSAPTDCHSSNFGCCYDGVTSAVGPRGEGCPNTPSNTQRPLSCDLAVTIGPCDQWTSRYYYDQSDSRCMHFWYGGCHGNSNNFVSEEECQQTCLSQLRVTPLQLAERLFPVRKRLGSGAGNHTRRLHRPVADTMQQSDPAASRTSAGVSIDKSDPSSVEGLVGQRVVLPCRVSPRPSSSVVVEWRRDGVLVDPIRHQQQPDGSQLVGPVTLQDSGWLLCVATRDRERDYRYIHLSVSGTEADSSQSYTSHSSSRFTIDYSSLVETRVGQTAKLQCTVLPASAIHTVTIHWSRAGQPLNSLRHAQHSDGTLVINQVTSEDSGMYTCTLTDSHKSEERQIQLKVFGDLRITKAPTDVHVAPGGIAQLPCVVSGENARLGWSRNGVPVRPDGFHVHVSADGTLILNNVQPTDEGTYTCNAYIGTYSVSAAAEVRLVKSPQQDFDGSQGLTPDCVDQPELANCRLIVYARLCSNQYYWSFCCASCAKYTRAKDRRRHIRSSGHVQ